MINLTLIGDHQIHTSYDQAERHADEWAGDNDMDVCVVEVYEGPYEGQMIVMPIDEADLFTARGDEDDARIIYTAQRAPEHFRGL